MKAKTANDPATMQSVHDALGALVAGEDKNPGALPSAAVAHIQKARRILRTELKRT